MAGSGLPSRHRPVEQIRGGQQVVGDPLPSCPLRADSDTSPSSRLLGGILSGSCQGGGVVGKRCRCLWVPRGGAVAAYLLQRNQLYADRDLKTVLSGCSEYSSAATSGRCCRSPSRWRWGLVVARLNDPDAEHRGTSLKTCGRCSKCCGRTRGSPRRASRRRVLHAGHQRPSPRRSAARPARRCSGAKTPPAPRQPLLPCAGIRYAAIPGAQRDGREEHSGRRRRMCWLGHLRGRLYRCH